MPAQDQALNEFLGLQAHWETTLEQKLLPITVYKKMLESWISFKRTLNCIASRDKFGMQLDTCGQFQSKADGVLTKLLTFFSVARYEDLPDAICFPDKFKGVCATAPLSGSPLSHGVFCNEVPKRIAAAMELIAAEKEKDRINQLLIEQKNREAALATAKHRTQEWFRNESFYQQLFLQTLTTLDLEINRIRRLNNEDNRIAILNNCMQELRNIQTKTQERYVALIFKHGSIKPNCDEPIKLDSKKQVIALINQHLVVNKPLNSWSRKLGRSILNALMLITLLPLPICYAATGKWFLNRNTHCHRAALTIQDGLGKLTPTSVISPGA